MKDKKIKIEAKKANLEQLFSIAKIIGLESYENMNKEMLRERIIKFI